MVLIGIGARSKHYEELLTKKVQCIDWLEVHTENFLYHTPQRDYLLKLSGLYDISLHGVGLSLGSADGVCRQYLRRIKNLSDEIKPFLISEHLSWNIAGRAHLPDLFPLPYNKEALQVCIKNIKTTQEVLGRQILVENPSSYLEFSHSTFSEEEFLVTLAKKSGCGILLDVNNIFVSAHNHGFCPKAYIDSIPPELVGEIHLAGHSEKTLGSGFKLLVDTHSKPVCDNVWRLYSYAAARFGRVPTLIEWDSQVPPLGALLSEANKARAAFANTSFLAEIN